LSWSAGMRRFSTTEESHAPASARAARTHTAWGFTQYRLRYFPDEHLSVRARLREPLADAGGPVRGDPGPGALACGPDRCPPVDYQTVGEGRRPGVSRRKGRPSGRAARR